VGQTRENIDLESIKRPEPFFRHGPSQVDSFIPIDGSKPVRITSSTHGMDGYITTDSVEIASMRIRIQAKIEGAHDRINISECNLAPDSDVLVLSYGVTARSVRAAVKKMKEMGNPVSYLILKTLWPVPENFIKTTARNIKKIFVVEMNLGQYVREVQRIVQHCQIKAITQMDGRLIAPETIIRVIL